MDCAHQIDPELKVWLDRVLIPALVRECLQLLRSVPRPMGDNGLGSANSIPHSERIQ